MKTSQLFMGDLVYVRLPYDGGTGYGIVRGTRPAEVYIEWTDAPSGYYAQRSPHWLLARHVLKVIPKLPKSPQLAYALDVDEAPAPTVPELEAPDESV